MTVQKISNEERESIVKNHSFFCLLTERDIQEMVLLLQEEYKNKDDVIVNESDHVDKIFFIAEGKAEVTRSISTIDKSATMHISFLHKGDVIGLARTGLFSTTGLRTAKVTAMEPMILLSIELSKFYSLSSGYPALKVIGEKFLLMNFIKSASLFNSFTSDEVKQLAKKVNKIKLQPNKNLFTKNESNYKCYIILSGEIQLTRNDQTTILKQGDFLGDISSSSKNLSATTKSECELFEINNSTILEALKKHKIVSPSLWSIFINKINSILRKKNP